jgi:riboflavin synthase
MFTGIITDIGTIKEIDTSGDWIMTVAAQSMLTNLELGASVAHSGICLTVIKKSEDSFKVQLSAETLSKTTARKWSIGTRINLERALRMGDELGGHLVSGHVDGIAKLTECLPENDSLRLTFSLPESFASFVAPKGSIALDGVSLTVNEVDGPTFGINIIPYTQEHTTLGSLILGGEVNFEIDLMARYVARMIGQQGLS